MSAFCAANHPGVRQEVAADRHPAPRARRPARPRRGSGCRRAGATSPALRAAASAARGDPARPWRVRAVTPSVSPSASAGSSECAGFTMDATPTCLRHSALRARRHFAADVTFHHDPRPGRPAISTRVQTPPIPLREGAAVSSFRHPAVAYVAGVLALAAAYYGAAKVGQTLRYTASVAAMWPPAGVGIAALYLWGLRWWPGVLIGEIVVNAELHFAEPCDPARQPARSADRQHGRDRARRGAAHPPDRAARRARPGRSGRSACFALAALAAAISATIGTVSMLAGGIVDTGATR